jgi:DNA mismatch repair ATPase MutS
MDNPDFCKSAKKMLSKLPDLSRLISRFGNLSYGIRPSNHPDKRAVMYEEILYNKQKTNTFCDVLESYQKIYDWIVESKKSNLKEIEALKLTIGMVRKKYFYICNYSYQIKCLSR